MRLKISLGNSKIGATPNLSLTPLASCRDNVPCIKDCYAIQFYKMWPSVRNAWDNNLNLYLRDRFKFFIGLNNWLGYNLPSRFRFFVGGDFPDQQFVINSIATAVAFPSIQFLVFTKRYEFVSGYRKSIPSNYKVVLSMWPGLDIPDDAHEFPTAWLSCDDRFKDFHSGSYITCVGNCGDCGYSCWNAISTELPVLFEKTTRGGKKH